MVKTNQICVHYGNVQFFLMQRRNQAIVPKRCHLQHFAQSTQRSHGPRKERRASALPSVRLSGERHYTALHLTSRRPYMCLRRGLLLVNSYEGPRRVVIPRRTPNYEHHHDRSWRFARSRVRSVSI